MRMVKSGYILKVELTGFADNLDMGCDRPREWFRVHLRSFVEVRNVGEGNV